MEATTFSPNVDKRPLFFEHIKEMIGEHVVASYVRVATEEEISVAKAMHEQGICPHTIVVDQEGWPYDTRSCAICGKGLGAI